jgi:glycosyltransferase involved in cell wall biosynthesis
VRDGVNGLLVEPGDDVALAEALVRVLTDDELAASLAANAVVTGERLWTSSEDYADNVEALIGVALRLPRGAEVEDRPLALRR